MKKFLILFIILGLFSLFIYSCFTKEPENTDTPPAPPAPPSITITAEDVSIEEGEAIDVKSLFILKADGKAVEITDGMLTLGGLNPESPESGSYTVTLKYVLGESSASKSITVTVTEKYIPPTPILVIIIHTNATIFTDGTIDVKSLFKVTADGEEIEISDDMISLGTFDLSNPKTGTYSITLTYISSDGAEHEKRAYVTVKEPETVPAPDEPTPDPKPDEPIPDPKPDEPPPDPIPDPIIVEITSYNVTINKGESLNAKALFRIAADGEPITVTDEMLSLGGFSANASAGIYTITLTYISEDDVKHTKTATITVKEKVVLPDPVTVVITAEDAIAPEEMPIDIKALFTVTADGEAVEITDSMLSLGGLNPDYPDPGTYTVTLTYIASDGVVHSKTATVEITWVYVGPF